MESPEHLPSMNQAIHIDPFLDPTSRWQALSTRNPAADCAFVYCVKTTGIYCRPICKARLARKSNVEFFDFPWEAEQAGYRACKRCKPGLIDVMPLNNAASKIHDVVIDSMDKGESVLPSIDTLASRAGVSKWHFAREFKKIYGVTPGKFTFANLQRFSYPTPVSDEGHWEGGLIDRGYSYDQLVPSRGMTQST